MPKKRLSEEENENSMEPVVSPLNNLEKDVPQKSGFSLRKKSKAEEEIFKIPSSIEKKPKQSLSVTDPDLDSGKMHIPFQRKKRKPIEDYLIDISLLNESTPIENSPVYVSSLLTKNLMKNRSPAHVSLFDKDLETSDSNTSASSSAPQAFQRLNYERNLKLNDPNLFDSALASDNDSTTSERLRLPFNRVNKSKPASSRFEAELDDVLNSTNDDSKSFTKSHQLPFKTLQKKQKYVDLELYDNIFDNDSNFQNDSSTSERLPFQNLQSKRTSVNPDIFEDDLNSSDSLPISSNITSVTEQTDKENCTIFNEQCRENLSNGELIEVNYSDQCLRENSPITKESDTKQSTSDNCTVKNENKNQITSDSLLSSQNEDSFHGNSFEKMSHSFDSAEEITLECKTNQSENSNATFHPSSNGNSLVAENESTNQNVSLREHSGIDKSTSDNITAENENKNQITSDLLLSSQNEDSFHRNSLKKMSHPFDSDEEKTLEDKTNQSKNSNATIHPSSNGNSLVAENESTNQNIDLREHSGIGKNSAVNISTCSKSQSGCFEDKLKVSSKSLTSAHIQSNDTKISKCGVSSTQNMEQKSHLSELNYSVNSESMINKCYTKEAIISIGLCEKTEKEKKRVSFKIISPTSNASDKDRLKIKGIQFRSSLGVNSFIANNLTTDYNDETRISIEPLVCEEISTFTNSESGIIDFHASKRSSSFNNHTETISAVSKSLSVIDGSCLNLKDHTNQNSEKGDISEGTRESEFCCEETNDGEIGEGTSLIDEEFSEEESYDDNQCHTEDVSVAEASGENIQSIMSAKEEESLTENAVSKLVEEAEPEKSDGEEYFGEGFEAIKNPVEGIVAEYSPKKQSKKGGREEYSNCDTDIYQDENLSLNIASNIMFKKPYNVSQNIFRKPRSRVTFKESNVVLPSKRQVQEILDKIPMSELKRKRQKSNIPDSTREQMEQDEIEAELEKRKNKKSLFPKKTSKLQKPNKWIRPCIYDLIIKELTPKFGIKSRLEAEKVVICLNQHVANIMKKDRKERKDILHIASEVKNKLARLDLIKTHYHFWEFVRVYFDGSVVNQIYPVHRNSVHGVENPLANIL